MLRTRGNSYSTSFLDMLMNALCAFIILFLILSLCINPKKIKEEDQLKLKAEFLISMTWPEDFTDDIDLWVRDPLGNTVWFAQKEKGLMHLDRDDLGNKNDEITDDDGNRVVFNGNREIVAIRGIVTGEYIINTHLYRRDEKNNSSKSIPIFIELIKVNPYTVVKQSKIVLETKGEEKTAFRFSLDKSGSVRDINNLSILLVKQSTENPSPPQFLIPIPPDIPNSLD